MANCVDCGFCGYYINLGRGLKWEEFSTEVRKAFTEDKELNPPGQTPGTGNWNFLRCIKDFHEWQSFYRPSNNTEAIRNALLKQRECDGYFKYHSGFSAPQHYDLQMKQSGFNLEKWNTRIALLALIIAAASLIISLTFR